MSKPEPEPEESRLPAWEAGGIYNAAKRGGQPTPVARLVVWLRTIFRGSTRP